MAAEGIRGIVELRAAVRSHKGSGQTQWLRWYRRCRRRRRELRMMRNVEGLRLEFKRIVIGELIRLIASDRSY